MTNRIAWPIADRDPGPGRIDREAVHGRNRSSSVLAADRRPVARGGPPAPRIRRLAESTATPGQRIDVLGPVAGRANDRSCGERLDRRPARVEPEEAPARRSCAGASARRWRRINAAGRIEALHDRVLRDLRPARTRPSAASTTSASRGRASLPTVARARRPPSADQTAPSTAAGRGPDLPGRGARWRSRPPRASGRPCPAGARPPASRSGRPTTSGRSRRRSGVATSRAGDWPSRRRSIRLRCRRRRGSRRTRPGPAASGRDVAPRLAGGAGRCRRRPAGRKGCEEHDDGHEGRCPDHRRGRGEPAAPRSPVHHRPAAPMVTGSTDPRVPDPRRSRRRARDRGRSGRVGSPQRGASFDAGEPRCYKSLPARSPRSDPSRGRPERVRRTSTWRSLPVTFPDVETQATSAVNQTRLKRQLSDQAIAQATAAQWTEAARDQPAAARARSGRRGGEPAREGALGARRARPGARALPDGARARSRRTGSPSGTSTASGSSWSTPARQTVPAQEGSKAAVSIFVEETGKTGFAFLTDLPHPRKLAQVNPGDAVELTPGGRPAHRVQQRDADRDRRAARRGPPPEADGRRQQVRRGRHVTRRQGRPDHHPRDLPGPAQLRQGLLPDRGQVDRPPAVHEGHPRPRGDGSRGGSRGRRRGRRDRGPRPRPAARIHDRRSASRKSSTTPTRALDRPLARRAGR